MNDSISPKAANNAPGVSPGAASLYLDDGPSLLVSIGLSTLSHLLFVGTLYGLFMLLLFLGFKLPWLDALEPKQRDIQFVLVESPTAKPRDPNTKNRAEKATRSGGKKDPTKPEAETIKKAGTPKPKPKPAPSRPKQRASKPAKPTPRSSPRAPAPKVPRPNPKVAKTPRPVLPPNPIGAIRTPASPTPKVVATGPIVTTPSRSTGRGKGRSSPSPSQIPGSVSARPINPSRGSSGGPSGAGGSGSYNQVGSPGGGSGRPGIDALPEADYGPYMAELQRRIKRNWHPPSAREDKRVVLFFQIGRDGRLRSVRVKVSSGYQDADAAAMNAVRLSAPFRPLPPGHRENALDIEFTFDYNVYRSKNR